MINIDRIYTDKGTLVVEGNQFSAFISFEKRNGKWYQTGFDHDTFLEECCDLESDWLDELVEKFNAG